MQITIPSNIELFGKGATCFDAFQYMQTWLLALTKKFPSKYKKGVIDDIDSIEANYIYDIIDNLSSMFLVSTQIRDYGGAASICRSIVDRVAILKFIFANQDEEERTYRYYLYVLDGMKEWNKLLAPETAYDGKIPRYEYNALCLQMQGARSNSSIAVNHCIEKLNNHSYAKQNPEFHSLVVKNAVWQYQEFGKRGRKGAVARYKWEDLYKFIDERETVISLYSDYLSQYIHGLSMSIMSGKNDFDNFDSLMSVGVCLQGEVFNEIKARFNKEGTLVKELTEEEKDIIIGQVSDAHLQHMINKFKANYKNETK